MQSVLETALVSYNFEVSSEAVHFRASKVRNIEQALSFEEVREGGLNGYVHTLVKPASGAKKLVFERCFCAQAEQAQMESLLGMAQTAPLLISIYDPSCRTVKKVYRVGGWMISKWSLGELNAVNGKLLLETVEITYQTLENGSVKGAAG